MTSYSRKRHSHKKSRSRSRRKTLKSNKHELYPKYLIHATSPELVENILEEGIRPSSNTGEGQYKYNWVSQLSLPQNKSLSNYIQFKSVFAQLVFDHNITFGGHISGQHVILILDPKVIEDNCKDGSCILSARWLAGKKNQNLSTEYDHKKSLKTNLKEWSKFLSKSHMGLETNEVVFNKPIDPKYIKCILLLPPIYPYFYWYKKDENFHVIKGFPGLVTNKSNEVPFADYTSEYIYEVSILDNLKNKYPHINVAFTWEEADDILARDSSK